MAYSNCSRLGGFSLFMVRVPATLLRVSVSDLRRYVKYVRRRVLNMHFTADMRTNLTQ